MTSVWGLRKNKDENTTILVLDDMLVTASYLGWG